MSDYERGFYYAQYRAAVWRDQMIEQKLFGIFFAVMAILIQLYVGEIEFFMADAWILAIGFYLILTKNNFMKE